ncbi:mitochondrial import inner membrane translocase subunit Tim10 B [Nomia melanderi]|uniref:mitochondrial import inner membrane translocase subunit Tim10 B n=1 Tax=Nomia melanderi TaxID=2448451 RepID=UPI0013043CE0|nr:mitochondrial import inner membrane translocase subunit Tim10 B-like [Nomia melanderi]
MDGVQIRNYKDFILLYNQISEACFQRCTNTFMSRNISAEEEVCVRKCADKHIRANQKTMEIFMELQPAIVQKRIAEVQQTQAALEEQMQAQNT